MREQVAEDNILSPEWAGIGSPLARYILEKREQRLAAYRVSPDDIKEHANIEAFTKQGGYERRQIYELVQNGADALMGWPNGRIEVVLTATALYCANQGEPIDKDGVTAILSSHSSRKRGSEIGRFGLGFKSVLGVTNRPEFYSRTGCFRFNPRESEKLIRAISPEVENFPLLRLAEPLNPDTQRENDSVLDELMGWAVTVVKLPLDRGRDWLAEDMRAFPSEFLLFSPHVGSLVMTDRSQVDDKWSLSNTNLWRRQIFLRQGNKTQGDFDRVLLEEDGRTDEWKVFRTVHRPSPAAKKEAGILGRDEIPLMWAVPERRRAERSKFWAFFPTEQFTTLSGILNAPWKTNEDRQNVLNSRFNEELLGAAADLIVRHLPDLVSDEDPGRYIELFPVFEEHPSWGDIELARRLYRALAQTQSLLDADGRLCLPTELKWHQRVPREAVDIWHSYSKRPSNWMHPSMEAFNRRARIEHIFRSAKVEPTPFAAWLEALVWDKSLEASAYALRVAAAVNNDIKLREVIWTARILKTNFGSLVPPRAGTVFLSRDGINTDDKRDAKSHSLTLVHPELVEQYGVLEALEILGIRQVEATSQLEAMLERLLQLPSVSLRSFAWGSFWMTVHGIPTEEAISMLRERLGVPNYTRLWVKSRSGNFMPLGKVLLPGSVVDGETIHDLGAVVDVEFHAYDKTILETFGAVTAPQSGCKGGIDSYYDTYKQAVVDLYLDKLTTESKPQVGYLELVPSTTTGPLDVYSILTNSTSKANFMHALLQYAVTEEPWVMRHKTIRDKYPSLAVTPPSLWLAWSEGLIHSSLGPTLIKKCFAPQMERWANVLPVARVSNLIAESLSLTKSLEELEAKALLAEVPHIHETCRDTRLLAEFYVAAIKKGITLDTILCRVGDEWELRSPKEVYVESDADRVRVVINYKGPHLHATPEQMSLLLEKWGLKRTGFQREVKSVPSDDGTPLLDIFPQLWGVNDPNTAQILAAIELVPCQELAEETITVLGRTMEHLTISRKGDMLYYLNTLSRPELFEKILTFLDVPLTDEQRHEFQDAKRDLDGNERLIRVREATDLPGKLLLAVGQSALKRRLPMGLLKAEEQIHGAASPRRFAELALAVFGVSVLQEFREEIRKKGLNPPSQWAGRHEARRFVASLGFPSHYAGFEQARRAPVEEVEGPMSMPQAHAYQEAMMVAVRQLPLRRRNNLLATRGLLSLPTGAGKTRVAVEALVQAVREDKLTQEENKRGPIIWIAQTDELCEQAVVTWRAVWRAAGPPQRLVISRLWHQNEADAAPADTVQVVVATIDKIKGCINDEAYRWLSHPVFVVVDEAHGAIGMEYTALFEWLGLSWRDQNAGRDRCPLLGLTATAFRGSEEETVRLVRRFGGYRLDFEEWKGNPYPYLQKLGVLSHVEHRLIEGLKNISLNESEMAELRKLRRLPKAIEEKLGASTQRNKRLLDEIKKLPADWPILLFAASVAHAQTMAALLSLEGISAAAISSETPPAARRHIVEEFRLGKIRVLTNCNVLTAGFDAPSVRCVIVARPVYSAVLYQQMIGRGLRGPKNGGKDTCDIINVHDTIANFGEELAFTQFEYLWNPDVAARHAEAVEEVAELEVETSANFSMALEAADSESNAALQTREHPLQIDSLVSPLDNPKVVRSIRIVKIYEAELKQRWRRLEKPLEETMKLCLAALQGNAVENDDLISLLPEWEEESFRALQSRARMSGIKDSQIPLPRRN